MPPAPHPPGSPQPGWTMLEDVSMEDAPDGSFIRRVGTALVGSPVIIEARTDDPTDPVPGQLWLRTDL